MIPFNKPYLTGNETKYIEEAVRSGKISGNGVFTQKCQAFFEEKYGFQKSTFNYIMYRCIGNVRYFSEH